MKISEILKWPEITIQENETRINFSHFENLSQDVKNDILRNAEIRFNSTVDNISRVKDISYKLITVFISLLSILVTLYFNESIVLNWLDKKVMTSLYIINIIVVVYSVIQLVLIIKPREQMQKGEEPLLMLYDELAKLSNEDQILNWNYGSANIVQGKIEYNEFLLEIMNDRLEHIIISSTVTFVVTLVLALILN